MATQNVNRGARDAVKHVLRRYGEVTSGPRPGPDFVIIGAKRGGTTSLYNYLLDHPSISPLFPGRQRIKGVHYFDSHYERGPRLLVKRALTICSIHSPRSVWPASSPACGSSSCCATRSNARTPITRNESGT